MTQEERELLDIAWHGAELGYLLDSNQLAWLEKFERTTGSLVWCVSRRLGKSYILVVIAIMQALCRPRQYIKYAASTALSARNIITPIVEKILVDCPPVLKPFYHAQDKTWTFRNGSTITVAGCDNGNYDALRGQEAHLIIIDEAAFIASLKLVEDALRPMLMTTGGRMLYASTPPVSMAHEFVKRFRDAQRLGRAIHATIEDNVRLSQARLEAFLNEDAELVGLTLEQYKKSIYFRREFMAEFITDTTRAAVPAWDEATSIALTVEEPRPQYFDAYASLDLGHDDPHAVLWAWWDFPSQTLHVERELVMHSATLAKLSEGIRDGEYQLYGTTRWTGTLRAQKDTSEWPRYLVAAYDESCPQQPYLRVADNAPLNLAELAQEHKLAFVGTRKDAKHLAVQAVNTAFQRGQIKISPRCTNLLNQLQTVVWNKQRDEWERGEGHHGDCIDALVYLWRNVDKSRDPRPVVRDEWLNKMVNLGEKQEGDWDAVTGLTE